MCILIFLERSVLSPPPPLSLPKKTAKRNVEQKHPSTLYIYMYVYWGERYHTYYDVYMIVCNIVHHSMLYQLHITINPFLHIYFLAAASRLKGKKLWYGWMDGWMDGWIPIDDLLH